ncbi:reverse transcriptase domain-containing protein [Tanacetum coccineum]|uniref:Reverse transcriptase domain-containing protein n=1 Tax=Tanacetum coccineum TaxID=301880 RepID=A0ABQ5GHT3_9ASTR
MKKSNFLRTEEAESAFRQMKELIANLPMLTAPKEKEELVIYLAASKEAVSVVLMTEREAKQMPIYFVSRALRGPEVNYTSMEKLVLALVHASKRLRRCGVGVVLTDPEGTEFTYALRFQFEATNNEAKYEALIAGLRIAKKWVSKTFRYLEKVKTSASAFREFSIKQVLVEELKEKSVNEIEVLVVVEEEGDSWMTPIHELYQWNERRQER